MINLFSVWYRIVFRIDIYNNFRTYRQYKCIAKIALNWRWNRHTFRLNNLHMWRYIFAIDANCLEEENDKEILWSIKVFRHNEYLNVKTFCIQIINQLVIAFEYEFKEYDLTFLKFMQVRWHSANWISKAINSPFI